MRDIFTHQDYTRVGHYQSVLEEAGIETFIKNQNSHNVLSEMPAGIFFPTLCVVHDDDYEEAMTLLRPLYEAPAIVAEDWPCPSCSQPNPANFEFCWNCKADRIPAAP